MPLGPGNRTVRSRYLDHFSPAGVQVEGQRQAPAKRGARAAGSSASPAPAIGLAKPKRSTRTSSPPPRSSLPSPQKGRIDIGVPTEKADIVEAGVALWAELGRRLNGVGNYKNLVDHFAVSDGGKQTAACESEADVIQIRPQLFLSVRQTHDSEANHSHSICASVSCRRAANSGNATSGDAIVESTLVSKTIERHIAELD